MSFFCSESFLLAVRKGRRTQLYLRTTPYLHAEAELNRKKFYVGHLSGRELRATPQKHTYFSAPPRLLPHLAEFGLA